MGYGTSDHETDPRSRPDWSWGRTLSSTQAWTQVRSEKTGFRWEYFLFNARPEHPTGSQKFRQAFHWAIDRQQLHEVVYFGTRSVGYDCILPGTPYFDPNYKPYTQDLERAKRLIDESNVSMPVSITTYMNPDPPKQRAAQVFQETVDKLGVKITLEQMDTATEFQRYRDGNFVMRL